MNGRDSLPPCFGLLSILPNSLSPDWLAPGQGGGGGGVPSQSVQLVLMSALEFYVWFFYFSGHEDTTQLWPKCYP